MEYKSGTFILQDRPILPLVHHARKQLDPLRRHISPQYTNVGNVTHRKTDTHTTRNISRTITTVG